MNQSASNITCLLTDKSTRTLIVMILTAAMIFFSSAAVLAASATENYTHGEPAYKHLEFIDENLPQRIHFSPRERETAEWLVYTLINMGHSPDNISMQEFPSPWQIQWSVFGVEPEDLLEYSQNVILTVPGISDKVIIVGAHYDSIDNNGISNNASGVAVLLESAERMLYLEHYYTIVYIFFGANNQGPVGAEYYFASLTEEEKENIVLMINIDAIFDGSTLTYAAGFRDTTTGGMGSNALTLRIDEIAQNLNEELDLGLVSQHNGIYMYSNHMTFVWAGFNVVVFYALDNFEPHVPPAPTFLTDTAILIEAMVHGTDDPELIESIYRQRENLEISLAAAYFLGIERQLADIQALELLLLEEGLQPARIEHALDQLESTKIILAVLEDFKIEEFVFESGINLDKFAFSVMPFLNVVLLIEAMVYGTDDPELIEAVYLHRESLEVVLTRYIRMGTEWLSWRIEELEQWLNEATEDTLWLEEDIEAHKRLLAVLEYLEIEEFVFEYSQGTPIYMDAILMTEAIEAMVHGTDDPELIQVIQGNRRFLESRLMVVVSVGAEESLREIERLEQLLEEGVPGYMQEMWQEALESMIRLLAVVEHPKMEEFVFEYELESYGPWRWGYVRHTPNDNLTFIRENWPGLIERSLRAYSIFLENILTLPSQSVELTN